MSDQKIPSQRNERLFWTTYDWCAISPLREDLNRIFFSGTTGFPQRPTEQVLRSRVLGAAATSASKLKVPWDPFNVAILIKPSKYG